jgi:hypothetical protein
MSLNLPAKEVSISTVNCMGSEQWRFGRWRIEIERKKPSVIWQGDIRMILKVGLAGV